MEKTLEARSEDIIKNLRLLIIDILNNKEEHSQWALNWIDRVNKLSQIF